MKRILTTIVFAVSVCMTIIADPEPIILSTRDQGTSSEHQETSRAPVRVPSLFIEEHTLTFTSSCVGCTLQLWQEGILVYTYDILDTDDVVLPSDLTGEYEIRLLRGAFTFVGTIEL